MLLQAEACHLPSSQRSRKRRHGTFPPSQRSGKGNACHLAARGCRGLRSEAEQPRSICAYNPSRLRSSHASASRSMPPSRAWVPWTAKRSGAATPPVPPQTLACATAASLPAGRQAQGTELGRRCHRRCLCRCCLCGVVAAVPEPRQGRPLVAQGEANAEGGAEPWVTALPQAEPRQGRPWLTQRHPESRRLRRRLAEMAVEAEYARQDSNL